MHVENLIQLGGLGFPGVQPGGQRGLQNTGPALLVQMNSQTDYISSSSQYSNERF